MSIRLICSDIDGTLLQYGKKELEDEIFEKTRSLSRYGSCIGAAFCFARHPVGSIPACASSLHRWQTAVCFFVRTAA